MNTYLGEFAGTFVFALGAFVATGYISNRSTLTTALVAGLALAIGVFVSLKLGGQGNLNPAFTLNDAFSSRISYSTAISYILAQVLGVVVAYLVYRYVGPAVGSS